MLRYALERHARGVLGEESLPDVAEYLELWGGELAEEVLSDSCEARAGQVHLFFKATITAARQA